MIRATILKNGALKITTDNDCRQELAQIYREGKGYEAAEFKVAEDLNWYSNMWFVRPEWIGALTDAPILTNDLTIDDNGDATFVGDSWWFPNYMIVDPWEELKNTGRVYFDAEENNKTLPKEEKA